MANTLRIKRRTSGLSGAPASLANAELAFNEVNNTLYYGKGDDGNGTATSVIAIGGDGTFATKSYVDSAVSGATPTGVAYLAQDNTWDATKTNTFNGTVNLEGTFQIDAVTVLTSAAELNVLDGVTAGTVTASKALVVDANKDLASLRHLSLTSVNKVTITAPATGSTLTIVDGKTLTVSNTLTFTGTDSSSVAFGAGGTVAYTGNTLAVFAATTSSQLAGVISDETGSGALVFGTSPTFTTSVVTDSATLAVFNTTATTVNAFGAATALSLGAGSGTTTVNNNLTVTGNLTVNGTTTTTNSTVVTIDDPIFTLGGDAEPTADDNKDRGIEFRWHNGSAAKLGFFGYDDSTGKFTFIPDATNTSEVFAGTLGTIDVGAVHINGSAFGVSNLGGLGTGVATFLGTPSSANLASAVTDETGSGALVFANTPTLVTPDIGVATATSVNKVAITAPASGATLTIANGKTLTASNTLTFTGTDSSSVAFGAGGTVVYESTVCAAIGNCTLDGGTF